MTDPTPRRRLLVLAGTSFVLAALMWSSIGAVTPVAAQKQGRISRAHSGQRAPSFDKPIFILMLGGDARKGNPRRVRMDAIQIVAIDPTSLRGTVIGIPRDSWVEIPGRGRAKLNEAGPAGGPELMVRTVERFSGCRFDYYTLTNFVGFRKVVDELGGMTVDVERRMYEARSSRIDLHPGTQELSGVQALAFARFRHGLPRGDFDRSENQGKLIVSALAEARKDYRTDVGTPLKALGALRRNLHLDIPLAEALKLGLLALRVDPAKVTVTVVDGQVGTSPGGASIVEITRRGFDQLVDVCSDAVLG